MDDFRVTGTEYAYAYASHASRIYSYNSSPPTSQAGKAECTEQLTEAAVTIGHRGILHHCSYTH